MSNLYDSIKIHMADAGAALWGVADISGLSPDQNRGYARAVSFALAVNPVIAKGILDGPSVSYSHEYIMLNMRLDALSRQIALLIQAHGFNARTFSREDTPYGKEDYSTRLPYKTIARLAGLGWIGRSALLISPGYGSAIRLGAALTNAPLAESGPTVKGCGDCTACRDACPGGAIRGTDWRKDLSRDALVDPWKCSDATRSRGRELPVRNVTCGLCIAACPYTKRYLAQG